MTDAERYLLLDTMCKLALAGKSDEEVFSFGRKMRGFLGDELPFKSMDEICEEAKKRAGFV